MSEKAFLFITGGLLITFFSLVIWLMVSLKPTTRFECINNKPIYIEQFNRCMDNLAYMRATQGGSYTTNDDEDLDEAISACADVAKTVSVECRTIKVD